MTWVRSHLPRASADLGIARATIGKCVTDGTLHGELDTPTSGWVEYDDEWDARGIWDHVCSLGFSFEQPEDVDKVVTIKQRMRCTALPWPDNFLIALVEMRDGAGLTKVEGMRLLGGPFQVAKAACERYAELAGSRVQSLVYHDPMELEDLLDEAPEPLTTLKGTCVDVDYGIVFEAPDPRLMGRVGAMRPGPLRWLSTLAILIHPQHGGLAQRLPAILGMVERLAIALGGGSVQDAALIEGIMRKALEVEDGDRPDVTTVAHYLELRELVVAWFDWQPADPETEDGQFLLSLLPADLPPDLRARYWEEKLRISADVLRGRALSAAEVARRAGERLVCGDARLRQWERLTRVIDVEMARIETDFARGREVRFPVRVSDTFRVVRPDGSLVPKLRQIVRMEIVTEDMLWLEAAEGSGWSKQVDSYISSEMASRSPARAVARARRKSLPPPPDGPFHKPGGDRRLYVVYAGTDPAGHRDDEHHPPHLVGLYAVSALVESMNISPETSRRRRALIAETGLPATPKTLTGLTWWPFGEVSQAMPHIILRHTGRIMLPYKQLRLMLGYGCAVARLELMSGLRIGETMQARHGSCFANRSLKDRVVATMRGRPKGWPRDRLWVIDKVTMALLKRIKGWVVENWYADLGTLPFVEYGGKRRNAEQEHCTPARYLFQLFHRAANSHELNMCLRITMLGQPHAKAHDYRYAFAKLLSIRRASRRARARALSHGEGSPMVERYGEWECEALDGDDGVVAELQDQLAREMLEAMIDAG